MTEPTVDTPIRDAIFEHEMFGAGNTNSGYLLEGIRHVEATWVFSPAELADELSCMAKEGLVLRRDGDIREYWEATRAGQIARELRWQQRKRRHPALASRTTPVEALVIAVIASGGDDCDTLASGGLVAGALGIYLSRLGETVCSTTLDALVVRGLVRRDDEDLLGWPFRLMLTADGRRLYAHDVVPPLGLQPPATTSRQSNPSGCRSTISASTRHSPTTCDIDGRRPGDVPELVRGSPPPHCMRRFLRWFYRTGWDGTLSEPTRHVRRRRTGSSGCYS